MRQFAREAFETGQVWILMTAEQQVPAFPSHILPDQSMHFLWSSLARAERCAKAYPGNLVPHAHELDGFVDLLMEFHESGDSVGINFDQDFLGLEMLPGELAPHFLGDEEADDSVG